MPIESIDPTLADLLTQVDTPTVCNAIEVAQGKRGHDRFTRKTVMAAGPNLPPIFGYAKTARIRASRPSNDPIEVVRAQRMSYYRYMSEPPMPRLAVVEDLDGDAAVGAFWGEVNTTVHKGLGVSGTLTNGLMRDLGDLAPNYQVLAGGVGPSHAFVHVVEIDTTVSVFGMEVAPGDFIHADQHGAVVVPLDVLPNLSEAISTMQASERLILEPARAHGFDYEKFEKAWAAFEKARV